MPTDDSHEASPSAPPSLRDNPSPVAERESRVKRSQHKLDALAQETERLHSHVRDLCIGYSDLLENFLGEGAPSLPDFEPSERAAGSGELGKIEAQIARLEEAIDHIEDLATDGVQLQQRIYDELMPEL